VVLDRPRIAEAGVANGTPKGSNLYVWSGEQDSVEGSHGFPTGRWVGTGGFIQWGRVGLGGSFLAIKPLLTPVIRPRVLTLGNWWSIACSLAPHHLPPHSIPFGGQRVLLGGTAAAAEHRKEPHDRRQANFNPQSGVASEPSTISRWAAQASASAPRAVRHKLGIDAHQSPDATGEK
jgi:hypothetical protein